ncbi:hypothetical protein [Streptomyces sp. NPDC058157]|uniref:hypothetical protein n=1 Tax=Streptomyces sp. NPDC058157 TaxID=3346360 RepID=UPI0036ED939B
MTGTPVLQAVEADGTTWDDPSPDQLHDLLADMNLRWRFVIVRRLDLEPADQYYMQVFLNDDLSYQVEYREGGPDRHFQAWVPRTHEVFAVEPVAEVVQGWACGRPGWRDALSWVPWSPEEPCARHHPLADTP